MRKGVYLALVAMAVGAIALTNRLSSTPSREPKTPQQTAIVIGKETFLADEVYWDNGLCARLQNGDEVYGFDFASQIKPSINPGNAPIYEASNK
jgi:hypothetical protein